MYAFSHIAAFYAHKRESQYGERFYSDHRHYYIISGGDGAVW